MTLRIAAVFLCLGSAVLVGQGSKVDLKAEEASLRALIANDGRPPWTDDRIAWSGAEKRPSVGSQRGEAFPEAQLEKRKNSKSSRSVQRVEVSASGDMAWEFSYGKLEYDLDVTPPRHASFEQGILRVWKKENGQWKIAASFTRPLDIPFVDH
ncbi:MAG TPA: nuclear transport factor 2 family protein [Bryobacteraceae bacterium]|jgi:hypothetical protein|nr:nuclear transport factor 2 family protein [Bryobacteraceae bacterium]